MGDGAPDGICIDEEAPVCYADLPNKCCVRVREGSEVLITHVPVAGAGWPSAYNI